MKRNLAAAMLAIGTVALPLSALRANAENSCIISGTTERTCASSSYAARGDLEARVASIGHGAPLDSFEARTRTYDFGAPLAVFRTHARGLTFLIH